jgi:tetratricopeptide (TPR) repeat protein
VNTLNSLGGPLAALDKKSETLSNQNKALEVTQKLVDAYPDDPAILISRASNYLNISASDRNLVSLADAFTAFRAGLVILDKLVQEYPAIIEYRRLQGRCLNGCGFFAEELGRPDEALAYFQRALLAWQEAVAANPERSGGAIEVARMHNGIGWILFGSGKMSEALEHFRAANSILQKLMNKFPHEIVPRTRSEQANTLINIAEIERTQGRLAEARASCEAAIAMRQALVRDFPEVLTYRIGMGECLMRLGQVKLGAGDIAGAAAEWRRAIAWHAGLPRSGGETAMLEAGGQGTKARGGRGKG